MPQLTNAVSWTDFVQAVAAAMTVLALPQVTLWAWQRLFFNLTAIVVPIDVEQADGYSDTWQIIIRRDGSAQLRTFTLRIMPSTSRINIVFATLQTEEDGGFHVGASVLERGAYRLEVEHLAPKREVAVLLRQTGVSLPFVACEGATVRQIYGQAYDPEDRTPALPVLHARMTVLGIQFAAAILLIVARLIYLGVSR